MLIKFWPTSKSNAQLQPLFCWSALHFTWTPTFDEFMHIIPDNLLSDEHVWAHPCCRTPPTGEEQVVQEEPHNEEFDLI
jgi:hypothetical protein